MFAFQFVKPQTLNLFNNITVVLNTITAINLEFRPSRLERRASQAATELFWLVKIRAKSPLLPRPAKTSKLLQDHLHQPGEPARRDRRLLKSPARHRGGRDLQMTLNSGVRVLGLGFRIYWHLQAEAFERI